MGLELRVAFRDTLQLLAHRAMATVRAVSDALNRILQLRHLLPQLAYLPLQGLSDVGAPLGQKPETGHIPHPSFLNLLH